MSSADVDGTSRNPDVPPALAMMVSRCVMAGGRRDLSAEVEGMGRVVRGREMSVLEGSDLKAEKGLVEVADEAR